jgi:hypothetical protein
MKKLSSSVVEVYFTTSKLYAVDAARSAESSVDIATISGMKL